MVLLDFGQCKALTAQRQRALAKLMIALDQGWPDRVVAAMSGMGLDFSDGQGGGANPLLVTIVANIMFDTKCDPLLHSPTSAHLPVLHPDAVPDVTRVCVHRCVRKCTSAGVCYS